MIKMIAFLAAFMPSTLGFQPLNETPICGCEAVANVQITGQGSGSISFSWQGDYDATEYKLWYQRQSDSYTSAPVFITASSYSFSGLAAGNYSFYFGKQCDSELSDIIGIEDAQIQ